MIKLIKRHWRRRWERHYARNHWHLIMDAAFILIILLLVGGIFALRSYSPNPSGADVPAHSFKPIVNINNPPLELSFSLPDISPRLVDGLVLKINWRNSGAVDFKDVKISLFSANNNFSVSRVEAESAESVTVNNRQLIIPQIKSSESGTASIKIYAASKNNQSRAVDLQARLEYSLDGTPIEEIITLDRWLLPTDLKAQGSAFYTSPQGDQLGVGPIPPTVGLPTNYWIFWTASTNGDLKDLVFSARLPKGVELTDNYSLLSGDFTYNANSRQVVWRVKDVKSQSDSYQLNFEVQIIPISNQEGKILPLLTGIRYRAVDALSGAEMLGSLKDPTTNLIDDKFNEGRGEVVAQ